MWQKEMPRQRKLVYCYIFIIFLFDYWYSIFGINNDHYIDVTNVLLCGCLAIKPPPPPRLSPEMPRSSAFGWRMEWKCHDAMIASELCITDETGLNSFRFSQRYFLCACVPSCSINCIKIMSYVCAWPIAAWSLYNIIIDCCLLLVL